MVLSSISQHSLPHKVLNNGFGTRNDHGRCVTVSGVSIVAIANL